MLICSTVLQVNRRGATFPSVQAGEFEWTGVLNSESQELSYDAALWLVLASFQG